MRPPLLVPPPVAPLRAGHCALTAQQRLDAARAALRAVGPANPVAESADADAFGVAVVKGMGGNPRALGTILLRIAGTSHPGPKVLLDHPETKERIAAIEAISGSGSTRSLLSAEEWAELKRICAGREAS